MPFYIAEVSENPQPLAGERVAQLRMSRDPEKGWRLSARAIETDRRLGGWVSNCARSIADAAYLWLISYNWQLQNAPDSEVDVQRALGQAPAQTQPGVTAIMAIDILRRNFVPAGQEATDAEGEPEVESYPGFLPTPGQPTAQVPARRGPPRQPPRLTGPVAPRAQAPAPRLSRAAAAPAPDAEDPVQNTDGFLRTMLAEVKKGADPADLVPYLVQFFQLEAEPIEPVAPEELRGLIVDGLRALRAGESPEEVGLRFEEFFGLGSEEEEIEEDEDEAAFDEVEQAPVAPAPVRRLRPLLPDEPTPAGMEVPPESPRDRAKMDRTFRVAAEQHRRAEAQIARAAAAGVKIEHPDATAARVAEARAQRARPAAPVAAPAAPIAAAPVAVEAAPANGATPKAPARPPRRGRATPAETPEG
jgi:hypothetical protein